jgi:hypothetical protein
MSGMPRCRNLSRFTFRRRLPSTGAPSDAKPLHYLVLIGQIELLPRLYGHVIVPVPVVNELLHLHAPAIVRNWIGTPAAWLDVRNANVDPRDSTR